MCINHLKYILMYVYRKVKPTMALKSIQNEANLAQGVGKGYP